MVILSWGKDHDVDVEVQKWTEALASVIVRVRRPGGPTVFSEYIEDLDAAEEYARKILAAVHQFRTAEKESAHAVGPA